MTLGLASALVLAVLIGVSLGLLGSGGAIITLPVLVYVAGIPLQNAVVMSLAVVGAISLTGSIIQYRRGHFHLQATLLLAPTGMVGAYFGAGLTRLFPPPVLMLIFAGLMLVVGSSLLRGSRDTASKGECRPLRCLALGAVVGVLTGFLGVGGGFLIVPALILFAGLDMKRAVGSSLAIISLNAMTGLAGQLRHSALDWRLTAGFLAVALVGMLIGLSLEGRLPERTLRKLFAGFIIVVAAGILVGNTALLMGFGR